MVRGEAVKDDSGSYAVFTEQGSPTSHITAAKVLEVISRLPRCAGQAADTVLAHTGQNGWSIVIENCILGLPESECPMIRIRLPKTRRSKSWDNIQDPVVLLERTVYGHLFSRVALGTTNVGTSGSWRTYFSINWRVRIENASQSWKSRKKTKTCSNL